MSPDQKAHWIAHVVLGALVGLLVAMGACAVLAEALGSKGPGVFFRDHKLAFAGLGVAWGCWRAWRTAKVRQGA